MLCTTCKANEAIPGRSICRGCKQAADKLYRLRTTAAMVASVDDRLARTSPEELAKVRVPCNACKEELPLEAFHIARARPPWGRHSKCKNCVADYDVERYANKRPEPPPPGNPRCPKCSWHLKFSTNEKRWVAYCWNKHCPTQDAGLTIVPPRLVL